MYMCMCINKASRKENKKYKTQKKNKKHKLNQKKNHTQIIPIYVNLFKYTKNNNNNTWCAACAMLQIAPATPRFSCLPRRTFY